MLDKNKLYYVNDREFVKVRILYEDSLNWYVETVGASAKVQFTGLVKKCSSTLIMVRQHTTAEIIDQCVLRWELSDDFTCAELFHYVEAAKTIRDELKMEGY